MWAKLRKGELMLSSNDIEQYKDLQKQTADANAEKQQMLAEIKVLKNQGLEKLKKYGYDSFSDIPKLKAQLEQIEQQVLKERDSMRDYCAFITDKKMEKVTLFNNSEVL